MGRKTFAFIVGAVSITLNGIVLAMDPTQAEAYAILIPLNAGLVALSGYLNMQG